MLGSIVWFLQMEMGLSLEIHSSCMFAIACAYCIESKNSQVHKDVRPQQQQQQAVTGSQQQCAFCCVRCCCARWHPL